MCVFLVVISTGRVLSAQTSSLHGDTAHSVAMHSVSTEGSIDPALLLVLTWSNH